MDNHSVNPLKEVGNLLSATFLTFVPQELQTKIELRPPILSPSLTDTCSAFSLIEDPALSFLECFALGLEHSLALLVVDNTALLHLFGLTDLLLRE